MGIDFKFTSHKDEVLEEVNAKAAKVLEEWGLIAERYAKEETPVDTGRLRNSISHASDLQEGSMQVGTNVEYAEYVETNDRAKHNTGRAHFLRDSISTHMDEYKQIMDAEFKS